MFKRNRKKDWGKEGRFLSRLNDKETKRKIKKRGRHATVFDTIIKSQDP